MTMKKTAFTFLLSLACSLGFAQKAELSIDSLKYQLSMTKDDTSRILKLAHIGHHYGYQNFDSSIVYGQRALELLERNNFPRGKARVFFGMGCAYYIHGDISKALDTQLEGLQLAEKHHLDLEKSACLMGIGFCYNTLTDFPKAIEFFQRARLANKKARQTDGLDFVAPENEINLGEAFMGNNQLDSALVCLQNIAEAPLNSTWRAVALQSLSDAHTRMGKYQMALECLTESLDLDVKNKDEYSIAWACISLSNLYKTLNQPDSCIHYAQKAFEVAKKFDIKMGLLQSSRMLAEQYEKTDPVEAIKYHKIYEAVNEELYGTNKIISLQKTLLEEQERQRKVESDGLAYQNRVKQYAFLAGLAILFLIAFILYRNNQKEKKARNLVNQQKEEIQAALFNLKSTQSQLIQSEKLASLGELTAGIAHEIQNPLNFVNNFSELSVDLAEELKLEIGKLEIPTQDKGYVGEILDDLASNQEKINHHGKRAAAIVTGMLQHARTSTGKKEPTDLNALADEYLRLSYHGLRAKDANFNAQIVTDFDPAVGMVEVIPQDIGRVFLNIINNAFYAVQQRKIKEPEGYEPTVSISSKKTDSGVEFRIKDNGTGIPDDVKARIFQPFFTTKPTGQGTGLGLSLAYDIVVKGHGGVLELESSEGMGSEFIIALPANNIEV
jgi:two-component system, NtrC family, sensor kinase